MQYEFTLTLKPVMYKFTAQQQFDKTKNILIKILSKYTCSAVAELTQENNVHYHVLIELKNHEIRDQLLNSFRGFLIWGRKSCSQLMNYPKYVTYMLKSISTVWPIIKGYPLIIDDLNIDIPKEDHE